MNENRQTVVIEEPHHVERSYYCPRVTAYPYRLQWVALLLSLFLGWAGIHRFYTGKIGTGIIWLITGGLFGIGWFLDFVFILLGAYRDKAGFPLV